MPLFLSGHLKAAIIVPSFKHSAKRAQPRDTRPENCRDREVFPHPFPKSSPQPPRLSGKVPSGRAEAALDLSTAASWLAGVGHPRPAPSEGLSSIGAENPDVRPGDGGSPRP